MFIAAGRASRAAHERERIRLQILARTIDQLLATASERLASPRGLDGWTGEQAQRPRCQHTTATIRAALSRRPRAHFADPTGTGLAEAQELGRQALSEGISILDVVSIHMEARRGLFPDVGSRFADIDAFLRRSLLAFQHLQDELHEAQRLADAEGRRIAALRRMRDVAAALAGRRPDGRWRR